MIYFVWRACLAEYVFRLEIEVYDVAGVHVRHSAAYLSHEENAVLLRQYEVVCNHAFEQLATTDTEEQKLLISGQLEQKNSLIKST